MTWTLLIALPLAALVALFAIRPLRRAVVTRPLFAAYRRMLPHMSQTEKEALDAGSVWWEGELFHGRPDWRKLLAYPQPKLTAEEQSFLDNEVSEACRLVEDWNVSHERYDMSPEAWQYIKDKGLNVNVIVGQGLEVEDHHDRFENILQANPDLLVCTGADLEAIYRQIAGRNGRRSSPPQAVFHPAAFLAKSPAAFV